MIGYLITRMIFKKSNKIMFDVRMSKSETKHINNESVQEKMVRIKKSSKIKKE